MSFFNSLYDDHDDGRLKPSPATTTTTAKTALLSSSSSTPPSPYYSMTNTATTTTTMCTSISSTATVDGRMLTTSTIDTIDHFKSKMKELKEIETNARLGKLRLRALEDSTTHLNELILIIRAAIDYYYYEDESTTTTTTTHDTSSSKMDDDQTSFKNFQNSDKTMSTKKLNPLVKQFNMRYKVLTLNELFVRLPDDNKEDNDGLLSVDEKGNDFSGCEYDDEGNIITFVEDESLFIPSIIKTTCKDDFLDSPYQYYMQLYEEALRFLEYAKTTPSLALKYFFTLEAYISLDVAITEMDDDTILKMRSSYNSETVNRITIKHTTVFNSLLSLRYLLFDASYKEKSSVINQKNIFDPLKSCFNVLRLFKTCSQKVYINEMTEWQLNCYNNIVSDIYNGYCTNTLLFVYSSLDRMKRASYVNIEPRLKIAYNDIRCGNRAKLIYKTLVMETYANDIKREKSFFNLYYNNASIQCDSDGFLCGYKDPFASTSNSVLLQSLASLKAKRETKRCRNKELNSMVSSVFASSSSPSNSNNNQHINARAPKLLPSVLSQNTLNTVHEQKSVTSSSSLSTKTPTSQQSSLPHKNPSTIIVTNTNDNVSKIKQSNNDNNNNKNHAPITTQKITRKPSSSSIRKKLKEKLQQQLSQQQQQIAINQSTEYVLTDNTGTSSEESILSPRDYLSTPSQLMTNIIEENEEYREEENKEEDNSDTKALENATSCSHDNDKDDAFARSTKKKKNKRRGGGYIRKILSESKKLSGRKEEIMRQSLRLTCDSQSPLLMITAQQQSAWSASANTHQKLLTNTHK